MHCDQAVVWHCNSRDGNDDGDGDTHGHMVMVTVMVMEMVTVASYSMQYNSVMMATV